MQPRFFVRVLPSVIVLAAVVLLLPNNVNAQKKTSRLSTLSTVGRKSANSETILKRGDKRIDDHNNDDYDDVHLLLARSIHKRLNNSASLSSSSSNHDGSNYDLTDVVRALRSISSTQAALKKIDGTAHEMYQRTHKSSTTLGEEEDEGEDGDNNNKWNTVGKDEDDDEEDAKDSSSGGNNKKKTKLGGLKVAGRMSRNAARVGCIADALFAAELCELLLLYEHPFSEGEDANSAPVGEEKIRSTTILPHTAAEDDEGTLAPWTGRKVVLNTTIYSDECDDDNDDDDDDNDVATSAKQNYRLAISILVIYEHDYDGGAGRKHGGVDDLLMFTKEELEDVNNPDEDSSVIQPMPQKNAPDETRPRGRYLIILSDHFENTQSTHQDSSSSVSRCKNDLPLIISTLDKRPTQLQLPSKQYEEAERRRSASVCGPLYHMAIKVLETTLPVLNQEIFDRSSPDESNANMDDESLIAGKSDDLQSKKAAIHFVGYSLAGGVAAISASIMDGTLPWVLPKASDKRQQQHALPFAGSGSARTSALCLGPPPCLSSNMKSDYITSVIHGDDIVCRTTHKTITHLCDRARRTIKGGILGRSVGWMGEAVSLTMSGLKGDNKDKKEAELVVPGNVYLIRPRRIGGGSSSIHEVGGRGSRESIRAALLWQLNDVLVSKSLWTHHRLDAYIHSLDKVRLKGFADDPSSENENY